MLKKQLVLQSCTVNAGPSPEIISCPAVKGTMVTGQDRDLQVPTHEIKPTTFMLEQKDKQNLQETVGVTYITTELVEL